MGNKDLSCENTGSYALGLVGLVSITLGDQIPNRLYEVAAR